jgi:hypothetical protein
MVSYLVASSTILGTSSGILKGLDMTSSYVFPGNVLAAQVCRRGFQGSGGNM